MKKKTIPTLALVVVLALAALLYVRATKEQYVASPEAAGTETFVDSKFGVSVEYPKDAQLGQAVGDQAHSLVSIKLENSAARGWLDITATSADDTLCSDPRYHQASATINSKTFYIWSRENEQPFLKRYSRVENGRCFQVMVGAMAKDTTYAGMSAGAADATELFSFIDTYAKTIKLSVPSQALETNVTAPASPLQGSLSKEYTFTATPKQCGLLANPSEDAAYDCEGLSVGVYRANGSFVQTIELLAHPGSEKPNWAGSILDAHKHLVEEPAIRVADFNFDGKEDFSIRLEPPAPHGNAAHVFYLYDQSRGVFIFSQQLTDIQDNSHYTLYKYKKRFVTFWHDNQGQSEQEYEFDQSGRAVEVYSLDIEYGDSTNGIPPGKTKVVTKTLVEGAWVADTHIYLNGDVDIPTLQPFIEDSF